MNKQGHLQPVGIPGELSIGGAGLARCYINRPDLTAKLFIPDPFSAVPGARLYKTGDLARHLNDGTIEYIGRNDQQVKIRGYRIELGELEAALDRYPAIQTSVAVVYEDRPGDARIVAYIVLKKSSALTHEELYAYLRAHLPAYMLPAHLIEVDTVPTTPNGKIDRQALPSLEEVLQRQTSQDSLMPVPRSTIEDLLVSLWSQLLSVHQIKRHDNFFALGGHSLLATQLVSRIRAVFHIDIPLRILFEAPTIADLTKCIEHYLHSNQGKEISPIKPVSRLEDLPLSFAQQRLWFLDQLEHGNSAYHVPAAIRLLGKLDEKALERSIGEIVRRHEILPRLLHYTSILLYRSFILIRPINWNV